MHKTNIENNSNTQPHELQSEKTNQTPQNGVRRKIPFPEVIGNSRKYTNYTFKYPQIQIENKRKT